MSASTLPTDAPTPTGFCWVQIPVKDMARAKKFYAEAFGWRAKTHEDDKYQIVENEFGNLNGALRAVSEEEHVTGTASSHTITPFLGMHSVTEPLAKVKAAGGEIIQPGRELPGNAGFLAQFYDSERNVIGIWANKMSLEDSKA